MGQPSASRFPFYAVATGHGGPSIYTSWGEASKAVTGFKQAKYKGFHARKDAEAYLTAAADRSPPDTAATSASGGAAPACPAEPGR
jgi:viroplasmin and RNaseH domain-containing protein